MWHARALVFELRLNLHPQGVEDRLGSGAFLQHSHRQAAGTGTNEQAIAWHRRAENQIGRQQLPQRLAGFEAFREFLLDHRQHHTEDHQTWVHHPQAIETFQHFRHRADAEWLRLLRDQHRVGRGDHVTCDAKEARRRVDDAEVKSPRRNRTQKCPDACQIGSAHSAAGFVVAGLAAGHEREGFQTGRDDQPIERHDDLNVDAVFAKLKTIGGKKADDEE
ncbi:MAG: hypothetical protein CFE30_25900 [Bradyrhizobium sp. PARBB1]|nr:MAG: hypothetical protein CFE30_25900 [Bradyrhizobium sp. PARBB1]